MGNVVALEDMREWGSFSTALAEARRAIWRQGPSLSGQRLGEKLDVMRDSFSSVCRRCAEAEAALADLTPTDAVGNPVHVDDCIELDGLTRLVSGVDNTGGIFYFDESNRWSFDLAANGWRVNGWLANDGEPRAQVDATAVRALAMDLLAEWDRDEVDGEKVFGLMHDLLGMAEAAIGDDDGASDRG